MKRNKILILGHGRHGKDTLAELMEEHLGITFISSSWGAAKAILPYLNCALKRKYATVEEAYEDRHNHRNLWKHLISYYNKDDKARLCKEILNTSDCYVGMRCQEEYEASRDLFDYIFWVDASERVDYIDPTMTIQFDPYEMYRIPNHGTLTELLTEVVEIDLLMNDDFKYIN